MAISAAAVVFAIPADYGWVLLSAAIMSFSVLLIGFIFAGGARAKVFTQEFLNKHFGEQHKKAFGEDIKRGGYPDAGSGLYSSKLSYEDWYALNNGQRAHYNFIEWIATNLVLLLISGISYPIEAAILGGGITLSRFVYAIGYKSGPSKRVLGALVNDLITLAQFVMSIMTALQIVNSSSQVGISAEL